MPDDPPSPTPTPSGSKPRAMLVEGPIASHLWRLCTPMAIGVIAVVGFNLVDTWFVSQLGVKELAAMSFTFPVVTIVGSIALGLGVGTTSVLSRAIGNGKDERIRRTATDALLLGVALVVVLATVGLLTIEPLFRALGATEETLPLITDYMQIWYAGMAFIVVPMMGNAAIRATGDTRTPAVVMIVAGITNAVLDPLFIFGVGSFEGWGLKGAAAATVIGRFITLAVALYVLIFRENILAKPTLDVAQVLHSWREVLAIGLPASLSNLALPFSAALLTRLVAGFGQEAVAAFGAGTRVDMLSLIPAIAAGAGLAPFVGQNEGAGRRDRVLGALIRAGGFAIGVGIFAMVALRVFGSTIAASFVDAPHTQELLAFYLMTVPIGHAGQGLMFVATGTFNALGQPLRASLLTIIRTPFLAVSFAILGGAWGGIEGLFMGLGAANLGAGILAASWLSIATRSFKSETSNPGAESSSAPSTSAAGGGDPAEKP